MIYLVDARAPGGAWMPVFSNPAWTHEGAVNWCRVVAPMAPWAAKPGTLLRIQRRRAERAPWEWHTLYRLGEDGIVRRYGCLLHGDCIEAIQRGLESVADVCRARRIEEIVRDIPFPE